MSMDKNDRNAIVTLAALVTMLAAYGGGILWVGSNFATLHAGVANNAKAIAELKMDNAKAIAELREDNREIRMDIQEMQEDIAELREDIAELRGVVYSHIGGHTHAAADIAPDGVVSPESVTPSE